MKFCPVCHREIKIPDFLKNINVKGDIKLQCSICNRGVVIFKQNEETKQSPDK